jgi:RNase H-fold protein (predicted Holliday junction resolvase)
MPIEKPEGVTLFKDYILDNIDIINKIKDIASLRKLYESYIWFYFQNFYAALSIFQIVYDEFLFSLAYGIYPKGNVYNYAEDSNIENSIFLKPLQKACEDFLFEDNIDYEFIFHFEHELYFIIILSKYLHSRFSNIKIILNFNDSNEQVDFSSWKTNKKILQYIDSFIDIGEDKDINNISINRIGDFHWMSTRLFLTRCFWGKCTFCTINLGGTLKKGTDELTENIKDKINEFLNRIKQYRDITVFLVDEAIESGVLLYLAQRIIETNIKCKISCRTRLSKTFTKENCDILARAGIVAIGMGLESINQRVTKLMNKREEYLSREDIHTIIKNMDASGINVHLYFIIGFPSEMKDETDETLDFVNSLLKECGFFTYTPNVFYLMKGSKVFENPSNFGITIEDNSADVLGGVPFTDNNPGVKYSRAELFYKSRSNISNIFFPFPVTNRQIIIGNAYWEYTDRSSIFYRLKIINETNCFLNRGKNINIIDSELNSRFILIPMIDMKKERKFYNIILNKFLFDDDEIYDVFKVFQEYYSDEKILLDNIMVTADKSKRDKDYIFRVAVILINASVLNRIDNEGDIFEPAD